jgi:cellulose synthase/poly-beta-1,6-N-acetylglucosamine synthase-like glycosyltransferase
MCDGCTDKTEEIVRSFSEKDSRVKMMREPERQGKATALNRLLKLYTGDVFIHLDADHLPSKGAILRLVNRLDHSGVGAAQGCQTPFAQNGFMGRISVTVCGLHNYTQRYLSSRAIAQHLGGGLFAIKRGVCDQIPEDIVNDDAYLGVACKLRNLRVIFEENAKVYFQSPRTLLEFLAQRRRIVFGHLKVQRETGVTPMVLEMCPAKHRVRILIEWFAKNPTTIPSFFVCVLLELHVNLRARIDLMRKTTQHTTWGIAKTTKLARSRTTT